MSRLWFTLSLSVWLAPLHFAHALPKVCEQNIGLHMAFRQTEYRPNDPEADLSLACRISTLPEKIYLTLFDRKKQKELIQLHSAEAMKVWQDRPELRLETLMQVSVATPVDVALAWSQATDLDHSLDFKKITLEGKSNPLKPNALARALSEVVRQERASGLQVSLGKVSQWSPEFLKKYRKTFPVITSYKKVLALLAAGLSFRFARTDKEIPLRDWILSQPDLSITLPEMFRTSLRLNQGDVYLSLLTIENLLAHHWTSFEMRSRFDVIQKLQPITNHYMHNGDKYGAWYHFWGLVLYGYAYGAHAALGVANVETLGSHILNRLNPTDETQEDFINSQSGYVGAKFHSLMTFGHVSPAPELLQPANHLNLGEDFRDRLPFANSSELSLKPIWAPVAASPQDIMSGRTGSFVSIDIRSPSLVSCKVELFAKDRVRLALPIKTFERVDLPAVLPYDFIRHGNGRPNLEMRVVVSNCANDTRQFFARAQ